ncbi:integrase domain-containing protein [Vibrio tapetis]|uniref:Integrase CP4-57 prophage n=1 Tax=Vibrio tapetis subsp. tapetis TaxID=1671868 RepID=A0A2N8ZEV2_9VIBR|nr:integrase domain-containing protein [Vibrio tapetis]SON50408.1 integrase; CP4-57 prophage [Vibrio tapetis subsp. tapetis]
MARSVKPLTHTEISKAKSKDKEYSLSDGGGLMLSIRPSGNKTWLLKYYRPFTKKRTNLTFGSYPEISLAQARAMRLEAQTLLAQNIDPKEQRDQELVRGKKETENTLQVVALQWFDVKKTQVTENYATDIWRSFELHLFPSLGSYPVSQLKATQAIQTLRPIAAKGSLETVKRLCQRINEVMTFSVNIGLIDNNPLAKIHSAFQAPTKKHMPTLPPNEIPELMQKLSRASIKLTTRCLIEWQLHTMVRPAEAAGAKWDELDFERGLWIIPEYRMKKRKEHSVPLTDQTLALLEIMKPISAHREFIFPADRDPKKHTNEQTANAALKRMGFSGRLVSHGLRALASTTLNEQGFDSDVIEAALSHVNSDEVRRAYNRADYLERRRSLMSWWSEHIEAASTGSVSLGQKHLKIIGS